MLQDIKNQTLTINDDLWGEQLLLCCMKNNIVDNGRKEVEIRGILRVSDESSQKADGGKSNSWHVGFAGTSSVLFINRAAWPDIIIKKGDKIRAFERHGSPWFIVISVNDRDHRRLKVELGEA